MPLPLPKPPIPEGAQVKQDTGKAIALASGNTEIAKPPIRRSHRPPEPMSRRQVRIKSKSGA
jgi:hypothetical protein